MRENLSKAEVERKLAGYPAGVTEAFLNLQDRPSPPRLEHFVLETIRFFLSEREDGASVALNREAGLREAIGLDSITIAELVFLIEDLFEIKIANEELLTLKTLGDLLDLLERRLELTPG